MRPHLLWRLDCLIKHWKSKGFLLPQKAARRASGRKMQKHSDLPSLKAALKQTISNMHYEHKKCGAGNSQTQSQNAGIKMSPKSSLSFQKLIDKTRAPSPIQQKGIPLLKRSSTAMETALKSSPSPFAAMRSLRS